jgi:hypothetical protein
MTAVVLRAGDELAYGELGDPSAAAGEAVADVLGAGLNPVDLARRLTGTSR